MEVCSNYHGYFFQCTLRVVIWFSTDTLGIFATLVYIFTMRVVIYDILSMAIIPTLSTSILKLFIEAHDSYKKSKKQEANWIPWLLLWCDGILNFILLMISDQFTKIRCQKMSKHQNPSWAKISRIVSFTVLKEGFLFHQNDDMAAVLKGNLS